MGTDIHLNVEVRKYGTREDHRGRSRLHFWNQIHRKVTVPSFREERVIDLGWGDGRNYDVFAMLADVRNGSGFAGVDTGEGFVPISPPRGLPEDASSEIYESGIDYGHSHSWLTLRELLDLEDNGYWDRTTRHRGVMVRSNFEKNVAAGIVKELVEGTGSDNAFETIPANRAVLTRAPVTSYAGGISGPDPRDLFAVEWEETYRKSASWLLNYTIPALTEVASSFATSDLFRPDDGSRAYPTVLSKDGPNLDHWVDSAELVRIVFWFDS